MTRADESTPFVAQLAHCLEESALPLTLHARGKVRDIYQAGDALLLVATDRVSAFDHVLGTIPFKGQLLTAIAVDAFRHTEDLVPNHLIQMLGPNAMLVRPCRVLPAEFIVRGYLAGSMARAYEKAARNLYGHTLPDGLRPNEKLSAPLLTPTTKAPIGGHDEPKTPAELVAEGHLRAEELAAADALAHALYRRGAERAERAGLILADTKYEFGVDASGQICLIDEVHTPDSSRYWLAADYEARLAAGQAPRMIDKETLRCWLRDTRGFTGDGAPPTLSPEIRTQVAKEYVECHTRLIGAAPQLDVGDPERALRRSLADAGLLSAPSDA